jgi:hypothetical protein
MWLSFDLGVRGDYEALYAWLDAHEAKECGPGIAYLKYRFKNDFLAELQSELETVLEDTARPRIYIIHTVGKEKGAAGRWLIGGRKSPPWAGFGPGNGEEVDQ